MRVVSLSHILLLFSRPYPPSNTSPSTVPAHISLTLIKSASALRASKRASSLLVNMFQCPAPPRPLPTRRLRYPNQARSHQPVMSKAIPITSHPIASAYPSDLASSTVDPNVDSAEPAPHHRPTRSSFSVSSESSFGSVSHYQSNPLHQDTRPRLAAISVPPVDQYPKTLHGSYSSWSSRDPPPHQSDSAYPSPETARPFLSRIQTSPTATTPPLLWHHQPTHSISLPDLRNIRPHAPDVVAARRRLENNSTKPFSLDPPPYSDHDIPLPHPYNAAYPHPLTAYASPGVNSSSIRAVGWRETLERMIETDLNLVKGSILAASDRNINPPALMIPVFEGEGCGIPERLWSRFESMGDGLSSALSAPPSAPIPPRFAQSGLQVVSTPGSRSGHLAGAESFSSLPADGFPGVRTNFSNVLRRASDVDSGRTAVPARRPVPQPTPFHKTELCRTWEHEGTCKYGSNCQFAHGLLELRMPVAGMPTPPSTLTHLDTGPSASPQRKGRSYSFEHRGPRQSFGYMGDTDSLEVLRPLPRRQSTPCPIGAERLVTAWKTVPVPLSAPRHSSHDPLFSFAEYNRPHPDVLYDQSSFPTSPTFDHQSYHRAAPTAIGQKVSLSSLSASAASFQSTSTPSTGYSFSTSPEIHFNASSYPYHEYTSAPTHTSWPEGRDSSLIVETVNDVETPDWEVLKRSIDATTIRSVWEE